MSTAKKVLIAIFSIIIIGAFAFLITWGIINFNKVKEGMSGTGLYTKDDVDNAYNDGYNTALTDKGEYDELINSYRDTITMQTDVISQLNSEKATLTSANTDYQGQISKLTEHRDNLQAQVDALNVVKANNEESIMNLNNQIADLQNQVITLQGNINTNETQIMQLNAQIENLQMLSEQLQINNELNLQTISGLNGQIANLNEQIEHLYAQIQTNLSTVTALNTKITELQNSVSYYEQYIAKFETDDKVLVTFEFAGSVYNLQLIEKGSKVSVPDPTSTEYLIFNGWTVDNNPIDLSTFVVTERVRIVADVTYRFVVKFMVEGEVKSTQTVEQGQYAQEPSKPRKTGFSFEYWTYGESQVFFDQFPITQNTTFIAKFTKLYDVSFVYEGTTLTTRRIKENATTTPYAVTSTEYKVFNGWKVNNILVNVSEYRITEDTVFVADITYKYEVKFMADDKVHNIQVIEQNGKPTIPENPSKSGYEFDGWTYDEINIIDVSKYTIIQNTTFKAKFTKLFTATFVFEDVTISTTTVREGGYITAPNAPTTEFKILNGWKVNGESVDVSTYAMNANTTFVADIAYKYTVRFIYNNEVYSSQIVENGAVASIPQSTPVKQGFDFVGWSTDGQTVIDVSHYSIGANTEFVAVFVKRDPIKVCDVTMDNITAYSNSNNKIDTYSVKETTQDGRSCIEMVGNRYMSGYKEYSYETAAVEINIMSLLIAGKTVTVKYEYLSPLRNTYGNTTDSAWYIGYIDTSGKLHNFDYITQDHNSTEITFVCPTDVDKLVVYARNTTDGSLFFSGMSVWVED